MRKILLVLFLFAPVLCLSADRFQLESELLTNFVDADSTTKFLTGYTYDANGNRTQSRAWAGSDSASAPMSSVQFSYNGSGAITEALLLTGTDTSSIVRYDYVGVKLHAVRALAKNGTLRFTDSLIYDGQGRKIEERRISPANVKTFFHRYTLNGTGRVIADSLFELISSTYTATQAILITYNSDSTVATETRWRLSGASWYCISTSFMSYAGGSLVSVTTYERDGAGTGITDSLAYSYDAFGNRIKEEAYDPTKAMTHRIVYTWREAQSIVVLMRDKSRSDQGFSLSNKHGRLIADLSTRNHGMIVIFDMAGRQIRQIAIDNSGIVPLTGVIGKGSFIAVFTSGINKQTISFSTFD